MKAKLTSAFVRGQKAAPRAKVFDVWDTELRGFGLRVQPSGKRSYYLKYRAEGRQRLFRIADAAKLEPAQARAKARELLGRVSLGEDPAAELKASRAETLQAYLEGPWAEHVMVKRRSRKSGEADLQRLKTAFSHLLDKRLSEITTWQIEKWRTQRQKSGTSPSTINRDVATLKSVLSDAVRLGLLAEHPIQGLRPLADPNAAGRVRFLSAEERARLDAALRSREERLRAERDRANQWRTERKAKLLPDLRTVEFADHIRPMVILSLNTGIRRGELFDLDWSAVDFGQRILTVVAASAKSGKSRRIPMNDTVIAALTAWRDQTCELGRVFPSPKTGGRFDNVRSAWEGVLNDADLLDFKFHDMRHCFASDLVSQGCDLNVVRSLMGHADLKMSLRYAHLAPQVTAAAVAKLDRLNETNILPFAGAKTTDGGK